MMSAAAAMSDLFTTYCHSYCNTLQHTAKHCNALQRTATHCNSLQLTATHCNSLQHTATHCNTLQHIATHEWPPLKLLSAAAAISNLQQTADPAFAACCVTHEFVSVP